MGLFRRRGYLGASLRDIEEATGLHPGSPYRTFKNKDGLFHAALEAYNEQVVQGRVRAHLLEPTDPVTGIRSFFTSAYESGLDPDPGCLFTNTAVECFAVPQAAAGVREGLETIESGLSDALTRARALGRVPAELDVEMAAAQLLRSTRARWCSSGPARRSPNFTPSPRARSRRSAHETRNSDERLTAALDGLRRLLVGRAGRADRRARGGRPGRGGLPGSGHGVSSLTELAAYMGGFVEAFPGHRFRIDEVLGHHDRSLARWTQLDEQGNPAMTGVSTAVHRDGRLADVTGFFIPA
ncbi:TetR/AcrR family transcriptional regulator [Kitasatospora sp. CMC57]